MSTIITKNSATSGSIPPSLVQGELAINVTDGRLFYGSGSGNIVKEFTTSGSGGGTTDTGSLLTTASFSNPNLTFTKGNGSTFNVNLVSLVPTSASFATTASFVTASGVYGPYGSNSILTASYAATASFSERTTQIDVYVLNQSGANIAKGVVVRITGSNNSSDIPRIVTASYTNDNNSANTLGITTTAIANGDLGYVITEGILKGIDTQAFTSGQLIYLGATGSIIGYAPTAPSHSVRLGEVIRHQSNNGSIYVRIDNGYELDELHNVYINTSSLAYGDLLMQDGNNVWVNSKQLSGSYGLTGSLTATSFTGSLQGTSSWANNATTASYAENGGVTQIIAGPNITLSPPDGLGQVTISSTGGGGGGVSFVGGTNVASRIITATGVTPELNGETNLTFNGSTLSVTGDVTANSFTGSLLGTASYADYSTSASYATTSSYSETSKLTNNLYFAQGILSADQSILPLTDEIIQFVDQYDPQSWWDAGTHKFTPTVGGYYTISLGVWFENPNDNTNQLNIQMRVNGNQEMICQQPTTTISGVSLFGTKIVYLNGLTDYVDFTAYQGTPISMNIQQGTGAGSGTWFSAIYMTM